MCIRDRSLRQTRGGSFPRFRSSSGSVLPVGNSYRNHKRLAYLPVGLDRTYSRISSSPACAACVAVGRRKNAYNTRIIIMSWHKARKILTELRARTFRFNKKNRYSLGKSVTNLPSERNLVTRGCEASRLG